MSSFFRRSGAKSSNSSGSPHELSTSNVQQVSDGDLRYVGEIGGNTSEVGYQEASGAPVETKSPLGYSVGPVTILFLNLSMMVGTGIFSTSSAILRGTGSVGLSLIFWFLGLLTSAASLSVYLEFAAYFPSRSGSEVAYLEQAFPRPRWFFPTTFAIQTVILSFSSGNSVVAAKYLFAIKGYTPTAWETKGLAIGVYTVAVLCVMFNTRFSYLFSNAIGAVKLLTLLFISIVGLVVLGGHTRVQDPHANFRNAFEGEATAYGVTNAMYKIIYAYAGFANAFNVVNEVKNPVKSLKRHGFAALLVVAILYMLVNIAFFAAIPKKDILAGREIAAGLLFTNVFGNHGAVRGLNFLIALSSFGNLVSVLLGQSRVIRECGRQGVLPWPRFWASTRPFGTPAGPYFLKWSLTILMILAPPAGDAFNFITDLQVYPSSLFNLLIAVGLYVLRFNRKRLGLPEPSFKMWDPVLIFAIAVQVYLLIMPWYPPTGGAKGGDVSFWYGTYIVVGLGILIVCGLYYWVWVILLPKWRGYEMRQEVVQLGDGAQTHVLTKVPLSDVDAWDRSHDASGKRLDDLGTIGTVSEPDSAEIVDYANKEKA